MTTLSTLIGPNDHWLGPKDAPVTLLEYGRYDCPHCRQAHAITLALLKEYGPNVRLVYRHFPRETAYSPSQRAAEAAEAAGRQGRFWEMHEHLLENQNALDYASLVAYAASLNLDIRQFVSDMETHVHRAQVIQDFESGLAGGIQSVPTFFINGIRHDGDWDLDTLLGAIAAKQPSRS